MKCDLEHLQRHQGMVSRDWRAGAGAEQSRKREAFLWRQKPQSRRANGNAEANSTSSPFSPLTGITDTVW